MTRSDPVRATAPRARWPILAALAVISAVVVGVLDYHSSGASPSVVPSVVPSVATAPSSVAAPTPTRSATADVPILQRPLDNPPGGFAGSASEADGVVPTGVTVFDNVPAVANLNPALLGALRRAATDAGRSGITFYVNSGWRSATYQEELLQEAIAKYGSEKAAARWVATPRTSAHVSGNAVDLGHSDATSWLSKNGARYGLCQIYRNEAWHYELRPQAVEHGCPPMYADPTQDPRMQQ